MQTQNFIPGKDASLESTINTLQTRLQTLGFHIEERSWLNPVEGIWSVHIRDRDCPLLFTNGKGATRLACLASALGEFFERLSNNYFWTHYYLGPDIANRAHVHYPQERWFVSAQDGRWPLELLNPELHKFYNPAGSIDASALVEFNSGNDERGICTLPYVRQRDGAVTWFPVNIIGNLYVSNGMSAGNTQAEARTQALSEIFERHIKGRIISEGICLPDVPEAVLARYPRIAAGIAALRSARAPARQRWWWYLDEYVAEQRKLALRNLARTGIILVVVFAIAALIYQTWFRPDPAVIARMGYTGAAQRASEEGNLNLALQGIDNGVAEFPDDGEILLWRATILSLLKRPQDAEAAFQAARVAYPDEITYLVTRATVRTQANDIAGAYADALAATKLSPDSAQAFLVLGGAQELSGETQKATQSYSTAASLAAAAKETQMEAMAKVRLAMLMQSGGSIFPTPQPTP